MIMKKKQTNKQTNKTKVIPLRANQARTMIQFESSSKQTA